MSTPKRLVVSTLKSLAKRTMEEQLHLKQLIAAQRLIRTDEVKTRQRITSLKRRIDRELTIHRTTLGLPSLPSNTDNDIV